MKAGGVSIALYGAEDYPLFPVKLIVRGAQPHQLSCLHHAYSIAREGLGVKTCLDISA